MNFESIQTLKVKKWIKRPCLSNLKVCYFVISIISSKAEELSDYLSFFSQDFSTWENNFDFLSYIYHLISFCCDMIHQRNLYPLYIILKRTFVTTKLTSIWFTNGFTDVNFPKEKDNWIVYGSFGRKRSYGKTWIVH